ncbi:MAG TPA: hypothetical protein GXZ30_08590 [Propionibacterium sp.]|nr:hypothetical protein [Propionibacterium sp.]
MSQVNGEHFERLELRTREDFWNLLDQLRPLTDAIEFVLHPTVENEALPDQLADHVIERRVRTGATLFWTVTHEGLAYLRTGPARDMRLTDQGPRRPAAGTPSAAASQPVRARST